MYKFIIIQLLLLTNLLFSQSTLEQIPSSGQNGYFEGKNGIDLNLGFYDNSNVATTSIVTVINSSEVTNATGGFTGSISYQHWFKNYLSVRIGIGAMVTNVENKSVSNFDPNFTGYVTTKYHPSLHFLPE